MSIITGLVSAIVPKVADIIDQAVPDKDLAAKIKQDLTLQMLQSERELTEAASKVIIAEAQGESWLQRNWRPLLMVFFAVLVGGYWFGLTPTNLSEATVQALFDIIQLGVGGYVIGRSGEKIVKTVAGSVTRQDIINRIKGD